MLVVEKGRFIQLLLVTTFFIIECSFGMVEKKFHKGTLCDLKERITQGCSKIVASAKTFNKCVMECSLDPLCIGASVVRAQAGTCHHHYECSDGLHTKCTTKEDDHKYMSKNCAHGGAWRPSSSTCQCASGWIGDACLHLPSTCLDLKHHGYGKPTQRNYITLGNVHPVCVQCLYSLESDWNAVMVFQNSGETSFNRTWKEYKDGFYFNYYNQWIGLEAWHALSQAGYTEISMATQFGTQARYYENFYVTGESTKYSYTYSSSNTYDVNGVDKVPISFGDCMSYHQSTPFSTVDMDNDNSKSNCALLNGCGWWHSNSSADCNMQCNILGKVPRDWNKTEITTQQRMKVLGLRPDILQEQERIELYIYLTHP